MILLFVEVGKYRGMSEATEKKVMLNFLSKLRKPWWMDMCAGFYGNPAGPK